MLYGAPASGYPIASDTALNAIGIAQWFHRAAESRYEEGSTAAIQAKAWDAWQVTRTAARRQYWMVFPKDLYRRERGWGGICRDAAEAERVLCELVACSYLEGPVMADYPRNKPRYYLVNQKHRSN
jgi:hypothetical protein